MTYSFNTLNADGAPPQGGLIRFIQELWLLLAAVALLFWLIALASHNLADPAWSTSGTATVVRNWGGRLGAWLADLSYYGFGLSVWWLVLAALRGWFKSLRARLRAGTASHAAIEPAGAWSGRFGGRLGFWVGFALLMCASTLLEWGWLYRFDDMLPARAGGALGSLTGPWTRHWLGATGSVLLGLTLWLLASAQVFRFSWGRLAERLGRRLEGWFLLRREHWESNEDQRIGARAARSREFEEAAVQAQGQQRSQPRTEPAPWDDEHAAASSSKSSASSSSAKAGTSAAAFTAAVERPDRSLRIDPAAVPEAPAAGGRIIKQHQAVQRAARSAAAADSGLPSIELLDPVFKQQGMVDSETLEMTSRLIEKKLKDFGVEVTVVAAQPGPVISRYEIEPVAGVKSSQVVNLAKDLARSLSLVSIRVIETIPGKNLMALELPNAKRQTIKLSEILGSQVYHDARGPLTIGLGKDIAGQAVAVDLARMPHCLVAGAIGSGKSVGLNAMILSLLYKAGACDLRLMLIDPRLQELGAYEGIPHLLCPVVTDMKQAANGLNWCVAEMERRYRRMSKLGVRNLAGYNAKIDEAHTRRVSPPGPFGLTPDASEPLERLPHIVVVISELADLMQVLGKKSEELIAHLAQKARAAGIHLILATHRPSVDVVTDLIKANIRTRISFQVSSKTDSRTLLDQTGAETLLGMGDMLYLASGTGDPMRVHGVFVSDDEVSRVVSHLKQQEGGEPDYIEGVLDGAPADDEDDFNGQKDPLYDQAVALVLQDRRASINYVQRKLKITYNRAVRLLEEMEKAGLVSAPSTSGQRDILVARRSG